MTPRILVTGASGFIGRRVVHQLSSFDVEFYLASRQAGVASAVTAHAVDFLDAPAVAALFRRLRPTHWLHLAWVTESPAYWTSPLNIEWVDASLRALRAFTDSGGQRVVGAGTCAEYDWTDGWCLEASTPCRPSTFYGAAKLALAGMQRSWCLEHGISAAWGRVFHLFGPQEAAQRFVASVARATLAGEHARCTSGVQQRDLLHVDDVASAFISLLLSDVQGEANIASGRPVALAEVARVIAQAAGRPDCIALGALPDRPGDPPLIVGDNLKLTGTGWKPAYTLEEGLAATVQWWREALLAP